MTALVTPRLVLRQWRDDDIAPFAAICADPAVMAHIGNGQPRTEEETAASVARMRETWDRHGFGIFVVERDERLIGFCGLAVPDFLPEILPCVEVGWRLAHSEWGQGLASEAARAVLDWAFGELSLERIVAVIAVANAPSLRLAERLGMQRERRTVIPRYGVWADVYELEATTWEAQWRDDGD